MHAFEHTSEAGRQIRAELMDGTDVVRITCDAPGERAVSHHLTIVEFDAMVAAIRPPTVAPEDG